jgi:hypothetical protein
MRWEGGRQPYISKSNCCPPNTVRTIAEVQHYQYTMKGNGLYINMFSGNTLKTKLANGQSIVLEQQTDYPWAGRIKIKVLEYPSGMNMHLRIPSWCKQFSIVVNGIKIKPQATENGRLKIAAKEGKINQEEMLKLEILSLTSLRAFDRGEISIDETLEMVITYNVFLESSLHDNTIDRNKLAKKLEPLYRKTLENRPGKECICPICTTIGIEVIIFRGSNRNRRRGMHNLFVYHNRIKQLR